MSRKLLASAGLIAVMGGVVVTTAAGSAAPRPAASLALSPSGFVSAVDNPYFPLLPGTTLIYKGVRDGVAQTDRVSVTSETKVIQGVTTTVVRDVARHQKRLLEKTFDWYAQDDQGNVWYFGEDTKDYKPNGQVASTEGSWEAGVDGAQAGIIMKADPEPPDGYRQELYPDHAEDQAWVLSRGTALTVPYGRVTEVLRTMEWTPLEPRVVDQKYYAPGLGIVFEVSVAGGQEVAKLVRVETA